MVSSRGFVVGRTGAARNAHVLQFRERASEAAAGGGPGAAALQVHDQGGAVAPHQVGSAQEKDQTGGQAGAPEGRQEGRPALLPQTALHLLGAQRRQTTRPHPPRTPLEPGAHTVIAI